jgi:small multidrug resistance pump
MPYVYLLIAIVAEVIATSSLKSSQEFTRLVPSVVVVVGYACAFYFLTLVLRTIPVGVTYALWSGLGIVLVTLVAIVQHRQIPDRPAVAGMALIIVGVAIINLFSKMVPHKS